MKLLTLNTHSLSDANEDNKLKAIAHVISSRDIDVIALQEVNQTMNAKSISCDEHYVGRDIIKEDNFALALSKLLEGKYYW